MSTTPDPIGPDVLDGWKDIADYLGKSVRTAQRWRQEFGLPVHRLGDREKEGVYAYKSELDEWRRTAGRRAGWKSGSGDPEELPGDDEPELRATSSVDPASPRPPVALRYRIAIGAIAVAVLGVMAWCAVGRVPDGPGLEPSGAAPDRQPARWLVIGSRFQIYSAAGEFLWHFEPGVPLASSRYPGHTDPANLPLPHLSAPVSTQAPMPSVVMADLDSDGSREVLFGAHPEDTARVGTLYCLDAKGGLRWRFTPADPIGFGGEHFGVPARIQWVTSSVDGRGTASVWIAAEHVTWFPTWIYRLDASGRVQGRYGSNGRIHKLRFFSTRGRQFALLGGVSNERLTAAVAAVDVARFGGAAPAGTAKYRCDTCPPGAPEHYLVFPRTDLASLSPGMPHVAEFAAQESGEIVVAVQQHAAELPGESGRAQAIVNYRLDDAFRVRGAEYFGEYATVHNYFASLGRIGHAFDAQREAAQLWPVLRWNTARYVRIEGPER